MIFFTFYTVYHYKNGKTMVKLQRFLYKNLANLPNFMKILTFLLIVNDFTNRLMYNTLCKRTKSKNQGGCLQWQTVLY